MGDQDSTAPVRSLEVSISFGRFENDLLSWDKWSTFSQNKYLEEVEKCATPGSVAEKKAYFEARNKLIGMRKMEVCQESSKETQVCDTYGNDGNQYDEEVMEKNIFESGMSSPDIGEQIEWETDVFEPRDIYADGTDEVAYINQFNLEKETDKTISECETGYPVVTANMETNLFIVESELPAKGYQEDEHYENPSKFNIYGGQDAARKVKEKSVLSELRSCTNNEKFSLEKTVSGFVSTDGENHAGNTQGTGSQNNVSNDLPEGVKEDIITKIELGLSMSDLLMVDDVSASKNSTPDESKNSKSNFTIEIHASETEKKAVEPERGADLSVSLKNKSAQPEKVECMKENPRKSSEKILPIHKPGSMEKVKKTQVSSVPRSPQISTPRISKPSTPPVTSASRISPMSRVKKTATSVVTKKSSQSISPVGSTPKPKTPSMIPSFQSPSKKESDSLSSSKRSISTGGSRKPTPTSLHMSLIFSPKVTGSTPILGAASVTEPKRSLIMDKMGDKDIVKRAFRAFQNMSIPQSYAGTDMTAPPNKVVRNRADIAPSTQLLQKDKERLARNDGLYEKSKKPAPSIFKSHDMEDKRKEVNKAVEKTKPKGAAQTNIQPKYQERGTHTGDRRQSLDYKGSRPTSLYQGQRLSKSLQDKGGS